MWAVSLSPLDRGSSSGQSLCLWLWFLYLPKLLLLQLRLFPQQHCVLCQGSKMTD